VIEHLLMLTCGWVGGVVSALLIRHTLDGRRPLDPALIPTAVAMPIAALPALPPAPQLSPYAPKKVLPKPTQRTDQVVRVWRAAKQDRPTIWVTTKTETKIPEIPAPGHGAHQGGGREIREREHDSPAAPQSTTALLPSIAWGTPHDGEGQTLTQEAFTNGPSTALSGHGAQAPRRRS
jgi:hypothetical protein